MAEPTIRVEVDWEALKAAALAAYLRWHADLDRALAALKARRTEGGK